jgi:hypothetical protein
MFKTVSQILCLVFAVVAIHVNGCSEGKEGALVTGSEEQIQEIEAQYKNKAEAYSKSKGNPGGQGQGPGK